jgi:hypothetical protein
MTCDMKIVSIAVTSLRLTSVTSSPPVSPSLGGQCPRHQLSQTNFDRCITKFNSSVKPWTDSSGILRLQGYRIPLDQDRNHPWAAVTKECKSPHKFTGSWKVTKDTHSAVSLGLEPSSAHPVLALSADSDRMLQRCLRHPGA